MKFGAFVEIAPGMEGLVPLSEMSATQRVNRSDEIVKEGERVSVLIKEIRPAERRILLSLKLAGPKDEAAEDWQAFKKTQSTSGSFATLGDKLQAALDKKKK
jgi:ribosomal protein S1